MNAQPPATGTGDDMLIPVARDAFYDPDPVVQREIDIFVKEQSRDYFGTDDVNVKVLTDVEIKGVAYPDFVFLRCRRKTS
ncbi:MAG: hypothetical protein WBZ37_19300 [Mycobacterium sp.]